MSLSPKPTLSALVAIFAHFPWERRCSMASTTRRLSVSPLIPKRITFLQREDKRSELEGQMRFSGNLCTRMASMTKTKTICYLTILIWIQHGYVHGAMSSCLLLPLPISSI